MATAVRPQSHEPFAIHEDARTEDTEMMAEDGVAGQTTDEVEPEEEEEQQQHEEEPAEESSEDEAVDRTVQSDMDKLQADFPGFRDKYRLIKRIGEGMFFAGVVLMIDGLADFVRDVLDGVQSRRCHV